MVKVSGEIDEHDKMRMRQTEREREKHCFLKCGINPCTSAIEKHTIYKRKIITVNTATRFAYNKIKK